MRSEGGRGCRYRQSELFLFSRADIATWKINERFRGEQFVCSFAVSNGYLRPESYYLEVEGGKSFGGEHVIARSQDHSNAYCAARVDVELSVLENHRSPQIMEGIA